MQRIYLFDYLFDPLSIVPVIGDRRGWDSGEETGRYAVSRADAGATRETPSTVGCARQETGATSEEQHVWVAVAAPARGTARVTGRRRIAPPPSHPARRDDPARVGRRSWCGDSPENHVIVVPCPAAGWSPTRPQGGMT